MLANMGKRKNPPGPSLTEEFLKSPAAARATGGRFCSTCQSPVLERVESECAVFNAARRTRRTRVSWAQYHRHVLRKKLRYGVRDHKSLLKHLRECRGLKIH